MVKASAAAPPAVSGESLVSITTPSTAPVAARNVFDADLRLQLTNRIVESGVAEVTRNGSGRATGVFGFYTSAIAAAQDGDSTRAVHLLEQYLTAAPKPDRVAQYNLGVCHARRGDWSAAAAAFEKATQMNTSDAKVQFAYAVALSHLDRWPEASDAASTAAFLGAVRAKALREAISTWGRI